MKIKDSTIVLLVVLFTVGMAYWAAIQHPNCDTADDEGLWALMPWSIQMALVQVAAAGGLALWTVSRRFIKPIPYTEGQARHRGEYLTSVAQLWHKANASNLALDQQMKWFRQELARRMGMSSQAGAADLVKVFESQKPDLAPELSAIFDEAKNLPEKMHEAQLRKLAQRMAKFRLEVNR